MAKSTSISKKAKAVAPAAAPPAPPKPAQAPASSDSDASSEDTSDASDSEPEVVAAPTSAPAAAAASASRTAYTPPEGYKLAKVSVEKSEFDWDEVNSNPEVQLWAIKVPKGFKAKYLESMEIEIPSSVGKASSVPSQPVGSLARKGEEYEAYVVADLDGERAAKKDKKSKGKGKRTKEEADAEDGPAEDAGHGGSEIRSLVPLLPKHSADNKLFIAPRPISLALNLTLRPPPSVLPNANTQSSLIASQPDPVPGSILSAADLLDPDAIQAKKRVRTQPQGLRMRLQLPGTRTGDKTSEPRASKAAAAVTAEDAMEVDEPVAQAEVPAAVEVKKEKRSKEEKEAKRARKEAKKAKKESD